QVSNCIYEGYRTRERNREGVGRVCDDLKKSAHKMAMLKSEQESIDMSKAMMQSLESCSMGGDFLNGLGLPRGIDSPSPSHTTQPPFPSLPQSVNDLLALTNQSQLIANNMDGNAMVSNMLAALQSQFLASQSLPFPLPSALPSKEVFCDLCDKAFANRSYLRNHRLNKHGIDEEEGSPMKGMEDSSSPIEGGRNSSVIRERTSVEATSIDRREVKKEEDNGISSLEMDGMAASSMVSKCDECPFETDNFINLIQHKATSHHKMDSEIVNTVTPPSSFPCPECDQSFESSTHLSNHSAMVHGQLGQILSIFGGEAQFPFHILNSQMPNPFSSLTNTPPVVKPPPAKRNYSSAGKNYCDVCNKEVCNKYFLRTHMLKMHGIVIDENKPVIANIDTRERERTGELTFRCDICSTTLSSRQQLRDHKAGAHGVSYPVGTPSTPSTLTPTRPAKPPNMLASPSMAAPPLSSTSISSLDLSSIASESLPPSMDPPHPSILTHSIIPDMMSVLPSASVVRETKESNGIPPQGLTKCQHCVYTTRFARNMEYHTERHERLDGTTRLNDVDVIRSGMKMDVVEREEEKMMERSSEEAILRMTTNAAIQMAKTNEPTSFDCSKCHRSFSTLSFLHSHTRLFHSQKMMNDLSAWMAHKRKNSSTKLRSKLAKRLKSGLKKNLAAEKEKEKDSELQGVERHSVTSGSISPHRSEVPEGMGCIETGYSLQSLLVSTPLGTPLPPQFTARLPISSPIQSPLMITLTLTPLLS
ncbi:hypothetical protein PMAYCL1PPCAC_06823, partial [Pristionchus mayeri]